MPAVNVTVSESPLANAANAANTGSLYLPVASDEGPTGGYTSVQSLTQYTNTFGVRSSTSSSGYDFLDEFFSDGGAQAYVTRVTDTTAVKAVLTLNDASGHPTVAVTALTAGTAGNALEVSVVASGGTFTVTVLDSFGDVLDTHGPYTSQASLLADTSSTEVAFGQSAGTGFTTAAPAALAATALANGANPNDLTDASYVTALANFPKALGPGTVCIPGRTTATIAQGLATHASSYNRFFVVDQVDASTSAAAISAASALAIPSSQTKAGIVVQGSAVLPPYTGVANRTVPGSACVAALRAQVSATGNDNQAPAGVNWQLNRPIGFTTAFGVSTGLAGAVTWNGGDAAAMTAGGVCFFASTRSGINCLDEFVSPNTSDAIYKQATAWAETMALVSDCYEIGLSFEFATIDGQGLTITALHSALAAIVQAHWAAGALYGDTANDAASINTASPVNTAATAQAGDLNAQLAVKISPYADVINIALNVLSLTQSVGASS